MTSAPNPRQRSNGNSFLLLVVLACLTGCFIFKGGKKDPGKGEEDITTNTPDKPDTARIPIEIDTIEKPPQKKVFNIAVLLPFYLDSVATYDFESETPEIFPDAYLGLEFYEGILVALDSLKANDVSVNLQVYDTHNDTGKVKKVLRSFENIQLILGPVYNRNLRIVAEYAREKKIPLFSPLSPSRTITQFNPYYFMINPTIDVHCHRLIQWINAHYKDYDKLILYQDTGGENEMLEKFRVQLQMDSGRLVNINTQLLMDTTSVTPYLSPTDTTVIVIPSFDEPFVNYLTNLLHHLYKDYPLMVFGMPTWNNYESLRTEYLQDLQVHITKSYWLDQFNERTRTFNRQYLERYKTHPSEYAYRGYDLMLYIGYLLNHFGLDFQEEMDHLTYRTTFTTCRIHPSYFTNGSTISTKVNFYENQYVHILKYENFSLTKLNR